MVSQEYDKGREAIPFTYLTATTWKSVTLSRLEKKPWFVSTTTASKKASINSGSDDSRRRWQKSSKFVETEVLPPTSAAAKYHSLRVFLQIKEWKGKASQLDSVDWGWEFSKGHLVAKKRTPTCLCRTAGNVQMQLQNGCKTARCTCRKNWMFLLLCRMQGNQLHQLTETHCRRGGRRFFTNFVPFCTDRHAW